MSANAAERRAIWRRLAAAALVEGEEPPALAAESPWFVRVMLGVAGWIGAIFLLIFGGLALSFLFESALGSLVCGSLVCAAATWLFLWRGDNDFLSQLGFACSLAGQALLVVGLEKLLSEDSAVALAAAVVQGVLFVVVPNFLHRVWTAGSGAMAVALALADWSVGPLAPALLTAACAWVWLHELEHARQNALWRAGGYGLTFAAMIAVVVPWERDTTIAGLELISAALAGAVLVFVVLGLLQRERIPIGAGPERAALAVAVLLALASLAAPGLAPAVAILVLGHANGNRVLTGLGLLTLLGYLGYYYYSLDSTLLAKSALLVGTGSALLLARQVMHGWWPEAGAEGAGDA